MSQKSHKSAAASVKTKKREAEASSEISSLGQEEFLAQVPEAVDHLLALVEIGKRIQQLQVYKPPNQRKDIDDALKQFEAYSEALKQLSPNIEQGIFEKVGDTFITGLQALSQQHAKRLAASQFAIGAAMSSSPGKGKWRLGLQFKEMKDPGRARQMQDMFGFDLAIFRKRAMMIYDMEEGDSIHLVHRFDAAMLRCFSHFIPEDFTGGVSLLSMADELDDGTDFTVDDATENAESSSSSSASSTSERKSSQFAGETVGGGARKPSGSRASHKSGKKMPKVPSNGQMENMLKSIFSGQTSNGSFNIGGMLQSVGTILNKNPNILNQVVEKLGPQMYPIAEEMMQDEDFTNMMQSLNPDGQGCSKEDMEALRTELEELRQNGGHDGVDGIHGVDGVDGIDSTTEEN